MDESSRASVEFREDVRRYLDLTEHTEQLQEENEELKIRLETLGNKVAGIWDDVQSLRAELETRIGRLELRRHGRDEGAGPEELRAAREAECSQYGDAWSAVRARLAALERHAQAARDKTAHQFTDAFELDWVRSALRRHLERFAGGEGAQQAPPPGDGGDGSSEEGPPPLPPPRIPWEEQEEASPDFEDATRVLRVSITSFRPHEEANLSEASCLVQVDGHKRKTLLWTKDRRATQVNVPLTFLRWSHNSSCRVAIVTEPDGKLVAESASWTVGDLISSRDTVIEAAGSQVLLRVEVGTSPLPHVFAGKHLVGPQERRTRGGAHVSVPRFVKKLKSLRALRDTYNKGSTGGPHADSVEAEFVKPLPDLNWLHEQVVNGWDGEVVFNQHNQTLLHLVAMIGNPRAVRALLKKGDKWDAHLKDDNGWSPFMLMVARQFTEGVQIMLFNGAQATSDTVWGVSPLHLAALSGNVELVKVLLEHNLALSVAVDDKFATPLHYAAYGHRVEVVKILLDIVDPNCADLDGHTPLLTAILRKSAPVMLELLQKGAHVSHSELWAACCAPSDVPILSTLVEHADLAEALLQRSSAFGHNVLMKVVMFLDDLAACEIIPLLLHKNMSVLNDVDDNRRTALFYAVLFGKVNVVRLLIDLGADQTIRDIYNNTLAHVITTSVVFDVLNDVVGGLPLDEENMFGWRPLNVARALQAMDVCSAMEAAGASAVENPDTSLVPSWKYRVNVPFTEGAANTEFLV